jgi:transcriptional regulator with XRE-family HTH domain
MGTDNQQPIDVGHEMRYWLGLTCRELRERAGVPRIAIAYAAEVDPKTIERFEDGETLKRADQKLAAYAAALGMDDPRDLWMMAAAEWKERGEPPVLEEPGSLATRPPPRGLAREIHEARLAAARALEGAQADEESLERSARDQRKAV